MTSSETHQVPSTIDWPGLIGQTIRLPGHFEEPVRLEAVRPLGAGFELRVRCADGHLEETVLSEAEFHSLCAIQSAVADELSLANLEHLRLLVESARIRLAYAYDRQFAVSLSGIRTLPHQIEAVYLKMLPQPRLRFLLAADPGAGKTIMARLLLKEMKLREAIERVLIIVPAPLTIQWQDELQRFFGDWKNISTRLTALTLNACGVTRRRQESRWCASTLTWNGSNSSRAAISRSRSAD